MKTPGFRLLRREVFAETSSVVTRPMRHTAIQAVFGCITIFTLSIRAAEIPKAPVPKSPYLGIVYRYADTMLEHGRDTYGPQKTGLLLSVLDRNTMIPPTNRPLASKLIRESDRADAKDAVLVASPQQDQNLLRLLYTLTELSTKPKYRDAADAELKWFLRSATSDVPQFLRWGEHLLWNVVEDKPVLAADSHRASRDWSRPWMLWDRCFDVAPEASKKVALGLATERIGADKSIADGADNLPQPDYKQTLMTPRQAGFWIRSWAVAYARTKDEQFCNRIDALLADLKREPKTGLIQGYASNSHTAPPFTLSLAIDCDGAAHCVPGALAARLRSFAAHEDEIFCAWPHDLKGASGFLMRTDSAPGKPVHPPTPLWIARDGGNTTAQVGMMCVSRYENSGKLRYRDLMLAAADAYLGSMPTADDDVWPATIGQAISLEVAAWRHSAKPTYLDCARRMADLAVDKFWGTNALPKATFKNDYYDAITGADTLALALVELHLNILHITAVRCPPNTIDR